MLILFFRNKERTIGLLYHITCNLVPVFLIHLQICPMFVLRDVSTYHIHVAFFFFMHFIHGCHTEVAGTLVSTDKAQVFFFTTLRQCFRQPRPPTFQHMSSGRRCLLTLVPWTPCVDNILLFPVSTPETPNVFGHQRRKTSPTAFFGLTQSAPGFPESGELYDGSVPPRLNIT